MRYLIIFELTDFWFKNELTENDYQNSEDGIITIIDIQTKDFHVEGETWQKVQKK